MNRLFKHPFYRKGKAKLLQIPRAWQRWQADAESYVVRPPVLCNSVPKSGTHLLLQIVNALPDVSHYGTFFASQPTLRFRVIAGEVMQARLGKLAPGESAGAHLFYHVACQQALAERNVAHFLIYRDPRDVAVSEALYLAKMNPWHRMHRFFKAQPNEEAQILLAIQGVSPAQCPYDYPDIGQRFTAYINWLQQPEVCAVRFEDLIGAQRDQTLARIIQHYLAKLPQSYDEGKIFDQVIAAIDPNKSHTFREGKSGGWKKHFTPAHEAAFEAVAGSLTRSLGYHD